MTGTTTTGDGCGCDAMGPAGPSRRSLLRGLGAGAGLGLLTGVVGETAAARYAFGATGYDGDVLVVLSLRGGFDGLSAVVPTADPSYRLLRPTIGLPQSTLLPLDSRFGLHPGLAPLYPLWQNGALGIVHAVGQADPTRSHFEAMREIERAAPGSSLRTGWIDRAVGLRTGRTPFAATQVGSTAMPMAFAGPTSELSMGKLDDFTLYGAWDDAELARWRTALTALHAGAPAAVAVPAATTLQSVGTAATAATGGKYTPANGAVYPKGGLGTALRDVARLVRGDVGLQVACVDFGDWDMHVNLGGPDSGWMHDHLGDLASALAAFTTDLGPLMAGVTVVTMTEFGRRAQENASGGVDHGHGTAMFLLGGGVVGGQVHGRWPGLAPSALDAGDLAGANDYRQVLAEVLTKRCRLADPTTVFPGLRAAPLGVVRART